jgi:hypothetical protein
MQGIQNSDGEGGDSVWGVQTAMRMHPQTTTTTTTTTTTENSGERREQK